MKRGKKNKGKEKKRINIKEKSAHGRIQTCDFLRVKPTLLSTVLLLLC